MKFNRPWALAGWARCIALGTRALIGPSRLRSSRHIFAKIRSSNSASSVKHAPFPLEPSSHLSSLSHRLAGRYRFSGLITPDSHEFPAPDPRALFRDTSQTPGGLKRHGSGNRRGKRWQGRNCRLYRPEHKREKQVYARSFVVAASTCESARLLLNSRSTLFPQGLANSSGVVGGSGLGSWNIQSM
jgi:hypothetical protein